MKIRLSEYEEGVVDGREESAEIMRLKQSEIEALTAHIKNLTKGTIRQQQAEIEALKEQIKENDVCLKILMQRLDDGTNEHYCLVWEDAYGKLKVVDKYPPPEGSIKLYTHPANPYQSITDTKIEPTIVSYTHPVKEHFEDEPQAEELHEILQSNLELTDEEWIITYQTWALTGNDPLALKRAILRKAQEK